MIKTTGTFHVLYTTDVIKTHDFYKQLGATITQKEVDKVVVEFAGLDLHFVLYTTEPFEEYEYIAKPDSYGQGVIFYIQTEDIEKVYELVSNSSGIVKTSIKDNHWGCREFLFEDPCGYKFAVYE